MPEPIVITRNLGGGSGDLEAKLLENDRRLQLVRLSRHRSIAAHLLDAPSLATCIEMNRHLIPRNSADRAQKRLSPKKKRVSLEEISAQSLKISSLGARRGEGKLEGVERLEKVDPKEAVKEWCTKAKTRSKKKPKSQQVADDALQRSKSAQSAPADDNLERKPARTLSALVGKSSTVCTAATGTIEDDVTTVTQACTDFTLESSVRKDDANYEGDLETCSSAVSGDDDTHVTSSGVKPDGRKTRRKQKRNRRRLSRQLRSSSRSGTTACAVSNSGDEF